MLLAAASCIMRRSMMSQHAWRCRVAELLQRCRYGDVEVQRCAEMEEVHWG